MRPMTEQQVAWWERTRTRSKLRFVLMATVIWVAVFGLMPLSFLIVHAIAWPIVPIMLGVALISGLLVGDVAWHLLECGYLERFGGGITPLLEHRRRTLTWVLAVPCVAPLLSLLFDVAHPSRFGIVISSLCVLAVLVAVLIAFERSMKRIA